jgi:hypothetical protein
MLSNLGFLLLVVILPVALFYGWTSWWAKRRNARSRRPFKDMPRPAGWSLQSRCEDLISNYLMYSMLAVGAGGMGWVHYVLNDNLGVALLLMIPAMAILLYQAWRNLLSASNYRLGHQGEQIVGAVLDRLSSESVAIFHDLEIKEPGKKPWNIDHVILTRTGVFAVETKSRRKPNSQEGHVITYDGTQLHFPQPMGSDRHGLAQAQRNAEWLAAKLSADNGVAIAVSPLLVFPGWYIKSTARGPVTVLNEKAIKSQLTIRTQMFSDERFNALASQLGNLSKVAFG